jgi:hypothetical protein
MHTTTRRSFISHSAIACASLGAGSSLMGCAAFKPNEPWVVLLDSNLRNAAGWNPIGEGNWSFVADPDDKAKSLLQGKNGKMGYLVSANSYTDFDIYAEFWADEDCNSGIFLRCQDASTVTAGNSYEVNIFDKRPDPTYGTGAIVDFAKVAQPSPQAANRWNVYEISARGEQLIVNLNGKQTVAVRDSKFKLGPIALQSAGGTIRFRKVMIRG